MNRPTFEEIFIISALNIAQRSTCQRLQTGAIITTVDHRQVLAIGYNGNAVGLENCCTRADVGNCGCLHAEENAVINCNSSRSVLKHVYVSHLPCEMCAKRLINLGGVVRVMYANPYRCSDAVDIFAQADIELIKFSEYMQEAFDERLFSF